MPRDDGALFGYNVGPNSWKSHLFPPTLEALEGAPVGGGRARGGGGARRARPYAFIGVRSCDIHAIAVQDRTFVEGALGRSRLPGPS